MIGLPTITTSSTRSRPTSAAGEQLADQFVDRLAYGGGQLAIAAGVHHHVRHAAHQVLAEADLRVHPAAAGDHVAGEQVAEMAGDGRRADVDGDAVGLVDEPGPDGDDPVIPDGRLSPCHRRPRRGGRQHVGSDGRDVSPCCSATAVVTSSAADSSEPSSAGGDLDVAQANNGSTASRADRGRSPCARPGDAPGSPRARRSRRRRDRAAHPSRCPATSGRPPR